MAIFFTLWLQIHVSSLFCGVLCGNKYSEDNLTNKSYNRNVHFERLLKWLRDAEQHNDLPKSTFQEVMSKEQSGLGHLLNL